MCLISGNQRLLIYSAQGALLGFLLYLVYVSDIGMDLPSPLLVLHDVVDLSSVPFLPPDAVSEKEE